MREGTMIIEAIDLEPTDTIVERDGSDNDVSDIIWYDQDGIAEVWFYGANQGVNYLYHELVQTWTR